MTPVLEARHLGFAYDDRPVLEEIDLTVGEGEIVGLLGPNGAGKTTLLELFLGLLQPATGEVLFRGERLGRMERRQVARRIAFVPQRVRIGFPFRVAELVLMGRHAHLGAFALEGEEDRAAALVAMTRARVDELATRRIDELSGGEQQRVLLASALAQDAELLLLDEPTASLDLAAQVEVFELLAAIRREAGRTLVVALHDLNLAALYCDRIVLMGGGRVRAVGTPDEVLTPERVEATYGIAVDRIEARRPWLVPRIGGDR